MKKLLLQGMILLAAGLIPQIQGQVITNKGGEIALHEARFTVLNYSSGHPVAGAGIFDPAGHTLGVTDEMGKVVISLPASAADLYTIKAQGYSPVSIILNNSHEATGEYEVLLPEENNVGKTSGQPATDVNPMPPSADPEKVKVYVKKDPANYKKSKNNDEQGVVFAVQLSATSKAIGDKKAFGSWEEIGPVFIHQEQGLYKVRIGPFSTQEEAKRALLAVKARGRTDAFIVVQTGIENHIPFDRQKHQMQESTPVVQSTSRVAEPLGGVDSGAEYKVRLASYLKPGGFNTRDIDQYGTLESYRQGEWTIMLIGGFKSAQEAEKVRDRVIAKGYKDATVVIDRGGVLETYNK